MSPDVVGALGHLPFPLALTTGPDHVLEMLTPAGARLLGSELTVGRPVRESAGPAGDTLSATLDLVHRTGGTARTELLAGTVTVGCVPVQADGAVAGVLLHLSDTAGIGVERAQERSAALQHLAEQLSRAATPAAIAHLAVTAAADVLQADGAGVYAATETGELEVLHAAGWSQAASGRYRRLVPRRGGGPLSDAVLDAEPVWLESAEQWRRRYPEMAPVGTSEGFEATACVPLRVEGRDLGAIVFTFAGPRPFDPRERSHLLAVAALCAQALDRARLLVAERDARADAERQLARMTFLARAGRLMEAPLSVEQRLQQLADLAVSGIADWCAVHLVVDGRVDRVAVAHTDPGKLAFVARLEQRYPPDPDAPGGAIVVSRTGVPVHYPEVPDEVFVAAARDAEHLELIRSLGMRSAVIVPLLVRDAHLGALTLVHAESGERFTEADLAYARQFAATAAVALDNARLYERQRHTADTLQTALLPTALPDAPGLQFAARYLAQGADRAEVFVGGDLYDVVAAVGPRRWATTVADVCGKGVEAASLTALIRHTVRADVAHGLGPVEVLRRLNAAMLRDTAADPERFATVVHTQLEVTADGVTVRLVNGGHVPALLVRDGQVETVDSPGTLLGIYDDIVLTEVEIQLGHDDLLVLHTDGVTEARGMHGWYGPDRLKALLAAQTDHDAEAVADAVVADVTHFQQGPMRDDIALLVVRARA